MMFVEFIICLSAVLIMFLFGRIKPYVAIYARERGLILMNYEEDKRTMELYENLKVEMRLER